MGSGDRVKFWRSDEFGLGFGVSRFPFAVTIWLRLTFWGASIGFGKGYDK